MEKRITVRAGEIIYTENKIIKFTLKEDVEIEVEDIKEIIRVLDIAILQKPYCILIDARCSGNATREARAYASKHSTKKNEAEAILINSIPMRLLVNSYIQFNKPSVPTRMFTSEEKAIKWLKSFL